VTFQIDLVDLSSLSSFNNGMRYLLTCIDVLAREPGSYPLQESLHGMSSKLSKRF